MYLQNQNAEHSDTYVLLTYWLHHCLQTQPGKLCHEVILQQRQ